MAYKMLKPILLDLYPTGSRKQRKQQARWVENKEWYDEENAYWTDPVQEPEYENEDYDVGNAMTVDNEADEAETWIESAEGGVAAG